jgi:hypothetical protein
MARPERSWSLVFGVSSNLAACLAQIPEAPAHSFRRVSMKLFRVLAFLALAALVHGADPVKPQSRLGINLAGPADWNTELPFVDVFRLSRQWISQKKGEGWGKGPALELDARGWVKRLEPDCSAETPLCTIQGGHYPGGDYTVLFDGEGKIEFNGGGARVVSSTPGRMVVNIDAGKGGFFLRVRETKPENHVRDIRVIMPGFETTYRDNPWHPKFLARWKGVACLRFMDFQETNNSKQRSWKDRPLPEDATWTRAGIPVELLCDLANRLEADPWFCLPHLADDDYVREFARLAKARLDARHKAYVEYSNEVWNGQFQQAKYAGAEGQKRGIGGKSWEAAWHFTAERSVEIFKIWEEVFGGTARLVRVLPSQAANAYVSKQIVGWRDSAKHADALAIAPYISLNIPAQGKRLTAAEVASWTVERLLDHAETNSLPECIRWMEENRKVAQQYGLRLVCYEAGQHFVGVQGGENNAELTKLLHAANAHPRMAGLYRKYFAAWEKSDGDLLCHFSSVGRWSKWGSWGLLQFADEDAKRSPKFMATMEWARSKGQPVTVPE